MMNKKIISGWVMVVFSLGVTAETVTNNLDMQSNLVFNLGYVNAGDSGLSFTNEAIRGIVVSAGQLSGVDPETGTPIADSTNLLPLKVHSIEVVDGTITGDGAGLANVPASGLSGSISASQLPGSGTWDAAGVTITNLTGNQLHISGGLEVNRIKANRGIPFAGPGTTSCVLVFSL